MRDSWKSGISFGITSGAITTMGLMVGLSSGTHSKIAVVGGVLTIAVADAFSDALGIHIHEEAENHHSTLEVWESTLATFLSKFVFAVSFLVPVLLLEMHRAILASVAWGMTLVAVLSYRLARSQGVHPMKIVGEHVLISLLVVGVTHMIGRWIYATFQ